MAVLLLEASVSSDGVSMSEEIVMALARDLLVERLFDLVDFIASAGGVFVTLGFDGLGEVQFELGQAVVKGFALERTGGNLAGVGRAVVHVFQHGLDHAAECIVTHGTAKPAVFLKIVLRKAAAFAAEPGSSRRLGIQRSFEQKVS